VETGSPSERGQRLSCVLAHPFRFASGEFHGDTPRVPALGEHTDEVLGELWQRDGG